MRKLIIVVASLLVVVLFILQGFQCFLFRHFFCL